MKKIKSSDYWQYVLSCLSKEQKNRVVAEVEDTLTSFVLFSDVMVALEYSSMLMTKNKIGNCVIYEIVK